MKDIVPYQYESEKEYDQICKLFLSSIFARKHGNIYLDRKSPTTMICSTISPEEVFSGTPTFNDVIHVVETNGIDVVRFWETLLPLGDSRYQCICMRGLKSIRKKASNDLSEIKKIWNIDPTTGMAYTIKTKKVGRREVEEIIPIVWKLSAHYPNELMYLVNDILDAERKCDRVEVFKVPKNTCQNKDFATIPVSKEGGFATGLSLPVVDSLSTISLKEYAKRVDADTVDMIVMQFNMAVFYYFKCVDKYATITSVPPKAMYYSQTPINKDYQPPALDTRDAT